MKSSVPVSVGGATKVLVAAPVTLLTTNLVAGVGEAPSLMMNVSALASTTD